MISLAAMALWVGLQVPRPVPVLEFPAWKDVLPPRRTAIVGRVGFFGTGAGIRHHWHERFSTEIAGFALFGRRLGQYSLSFEFRWVPLRRRVFWLHLAGGVAWDHERMLTPAGIAFVPDKRVVRRSEFFVGAGPGLEVFVHPSVSFSLELLWGAAWGWSQPAGGGSHGNVCFGVYVYFK